MHCSQGWKLKGIITKGFLSLSAAPDGICGVQTPAAVPKGQVGEKMLQERMRAVVTTSFADLSGGV